MSLFLCSQCGCVENTACCHYWSRNIRNPKRDSPPLCSACDPAIGAWHGNFPKRVPDPKTVRPNKLGGHFIDIVETKR